MFVRKKTNRPGKTSVVVVDKRGGKFRELIAIGVSAEAKRITETENQTASRWRNAYTNDAAHTATKANHFIVR
ncbi:hypothetical protein C7N43_19330 [Sphingobacteriales bacterium UPWRP_1]|nr:hypothetical protein BVG80_13665 [Sphingobacteriales bacterium TSM_CSM]PSJ75371.1 hypothetical protein C7N43_19330 [Sphingobacteriales bacterium UPWRP_1]